MAGTGSDRCRSLCNAFWSDYARALAAAIVARRDGGRGRIDRCGLRYWAVALWRVAKLVALLSVSRYGVFSVRSPETIHLGRVERGHRGVGKNGKRGIPGGFAKSRRP